MPGAVCMHAFARIYANYNDNFIGTGQGWRIKFQIDTNLHLNTSDNTAGYYKCFKYYLSLQPNSAANRRKYWFGTVRFSFKLGTVLMV